MFNLTNLPVLYQNAYQKLLDDNRDSSSKARVAVISMYCNRLVWTKTCIESLTPEKAGINPHNYKLFLVNNNSTDTTEFFLNEFSEFKPYIEQIRHTENKGKPWAFNHALATILESNFDYVVSVDGDIRMPDNWLSDMITCFRELDKQIPVGQLACDYQFMPGVTRTVNPNALNQPDKCKIMPNGIVLDMYPDVAGGCIIWKTTDIKTAGGYQIITSSTTGKNNLYGMDDGLINLHMKRSGKLSCYLVNVKAQHWGDYDALLFPKYAVWKNLNLNPISQLRTAPDNIGVEFNRWSEMNFTTFKGVERIFKDKFPAPIVERIENLFLEGIE
jgi:glycosyltransferase involved in cell wall biosynthesis